MKQFLRDPLFHFLLLGAGVFLVYSLLSRPGKSTDLGEIVVTQARIEHLAVAYATTFQRPPSDIELKAVIDDWIREEIAVREATTLKLGRDDTVIRRRLRQKFEFISDDLAAQVEPSDADLDAYMKTHAETFRSEPRFTYTQVYLSPDKHGRNLRRDATQLLARLRASERTDISKMGDAFLLEQQFTATPASEVARQLGQPFAEALVGLKPGQWQGPIQSGYGVHLLKISERIEGRLPALAEVRDVVRREWANARRKEMDDRLYQELLKRYAVTFEKQRFAAATTSPVVK
jgi:hypothetical protein